MAMQTLGGTALKRFHRGFRRAHIAEHTISVVLQSVQYAMNVGSIFRICDAVQVESLILTGITPTPENETVLKVGRGKDRTVPWRYEAEATKPLAELKAEGHRVFALEITENAQPYYRVKWPDKVCLVAGHEDHGITRSTLLQCDDAVFVPMWGKGLSLNVHVALAVVLFHIRYLELRGEV